MVRGDVFGQFAAQRRGTILRGTGQSEIVPSGRAEQSIIESIQAQEAGMRVTQGDWQDRLDATYGQARQYVLRYEDRIFFAAFAVALTWAFARR